MRKLWPALALSLLLHALFLPSLLRALTHPAKPSRQLARAEVFLWHPKPVVPPPPKPRTRPKPVKLPPKLKPRPVVVKPRPRPAPPPRVARRTRRHRVRHHSAPHVMASVGHGTGPSMPTTGNAAPGRPGRPPDFAPPEPPARPPQPAPKKAPPPPPPPPPPRPKPTPTPTPRPKGPTRNAVAVSAPAPHIPESLRQQNIRTFIRVRFLIAANGSCTVVPLTSTGNSTLDAEALAALRQWRWQPALRDGQPVFSVQRVKVEFVVE